MNSAFLADLVVAFHVAYVGFIVVGELLILMGAVLRWQWVRNIRFRTIHLAAILFVAWEAIIGMNCPLTVWEDLLRRQAGQEVAAGTFIGRLLHNILFFDCPAGFFTPMYIGFALLVLATLLLIPPRRNFRMKHRTVGGVNPLSNCASDENPCPAG